MQTVVLPYPPSTNRYWRKTRNGRIYKSSEAAAYQMNAKHVALGAGLSPLSGRVAVTLRVFRPIRRGDLDNRIKIVLDALQGVAFDDDKQVYELHAYLDDDKSNPRVVVTVDEI